jgi:hypothetical protein
MQISERERGIVQLCLSVCRSVLQHKTTFSSTRYTAAITHLPPKIINRVTARSYLNDRHPSPGSTNGSPALASSKPGIHPIHQEARKKSQRPKVLNNLSHLQQQRHQSTLLPQSQLSKETRVSQRSESDMYQKQARPGGKQTRQERRRELCLIPHPTSVVRPSSCVRTTVCPSQLS